MFLNHCEFLFTGKEADFVSNALFIFKSGMKIGNYHEEMNVRNLRGLHTLMEYLFSGSLQWFVIIKGTIK
jgi:hypothetical protein